MSAEQTLQDIMASEDFTEEARILDGFLLLEERFISASLGKRVRLVHQYSTSGSRVVHCGLVYVEEDL